MTTSVRSEVTLDLFRNPSWPLFSARGGASSAGSLAAYTLIWSRLGEEPARLLRESSDDLGRRIAHVLERHQGVVLQVLMVHVTPQPRSVTVLHRKIWKSPLIGAVPPEIIRGPEVQVDCGTMVRFATMATIPGSAIPWIMATMSTFDTVIPLLRRHPLPLDDQTTRLLAQAGLPPEGSAPTSDFDWPGFVQCAQQLGALSVRRVMDLAEGEVTADFFGSELQLSLLASSEDEEANLS